MKYGKDCCIGQFLPNGQWLDSSEWKFDVLPDLKPFMYKDMTDGWLYRTDLHIRVHSEVLSILRGFDYDGASIPRLVWIVVGHPMGVKKQVAAGWHDIAFCSHIMTLDESNDMFLELLEAFEENWVVRNECWAAVKACGGPLYRRHPQSDLDKYMKLAGRTKLVDKGGILVAA